MGIHPSEQTIGQQLLSTTANTNLQGHRTVLWFQCASIPRCESHSPSPGEAADLLYSVPAYPSGRSRPISSSTVRFASYPYGGGSLGIRTAGTRLRCFLSARVSTISFGDAPSCERVDSITRNVVPQTLDVFLIVRLFCSGTALEGDGGDAATGRRFARDSIQPRPPFAQSAHSEGVSGNVTLLGCACCLSPASSLCPRFPLRVAKKVGAVPKRVLPDGGRPDREVLVEAAVARAPECLSHVLSGPITARAACSRGDPFLCGGCRRSRLQLPSRTLGRLCDQLGFSDTSSRPGRARRRSKCIRRTLSLYTVGGVLRARGLVGGSRNSQIAEWLATMGGNRRLNDCYGSVLHANDRAKCGLA